MSSLILESLLTLQNLKQIHSFFLQQLVPQAKAEGCDMLYSVGSGNQYFPFGG